MLRLPSKRISKDEKRQLNSLQNLVNSCTSHADKYKKADQIWGTISKKGSKRQVLFVKIRKRLQSMCVGVQICNYCEQNLESDIEHIFPKKLFPERTFSWKNYVQVCKKCNTQYKSDRCAVFNPAKSCTSTEITLPPKIYTPPPTYDVAFINPREENPMDFLRLNLIPGPTFCFLDPIYKVGTREYEKAIWTLEILHLNKNVALVENRRIAFQDFFGLLKRYVEARKATNYTELGMAVGDFPPLITKKPFHTEKRRITNVFKELVRKHPHPTVWKEMIRQRTHLPQTNALFLQAPETLGW